MLYEIKLNNISPGDFVLVITLNIAISNSLQSLFHNAGNFSEYFGDTEQGLQTILLNIENKEKVRKGNCEFNVRKGNIRFLNVNFSYPNSKKLFNNLSITIPPSSKVGLVGYSGSGKTTFINLILALYKPCSGQIHIDGYDINLMQENLLRQKIGTITQEISLFNRSIIENIRYGCLSASDEQVIDAAKKARAHKFILSLPKGYNTIIGERGLKLSGGERQRIAMARVILKKAPILILDEATNQLDSISENEIQETLDDFSKDKTTIIIAHRLTTLLHLDYILVFDNGKIVQAGTHHDLVRKNGLYRTLWKNQSNGFIAINSGV
jgi:ATP-binding cassette subfamily B protein